MLPAEFLIAGYEAYACTESLITTVSSAVADEWDDAFNFFHSSLRMNDEQAFGILMAKCRILQQLNFAVETSTPVICVTMKVHGFVIEEGGELTPCIVQKSEIERVQNELTNWYEVSVEEAEMERPLADGFKSCTRQRVIDEV